MLLAVASIGFGLFYLISLLDEPPELLLQLAATAASQPWLLMGFVLAFMLIPLSMTMSLLWKTKESILASVFHSPH